MSVSQCSSQTHHHFIVSNDVVRSRTGQPLLSDTIRQRRLSFFGHLCRVDTGQDHSRALQACIRGPPKDWRRSTGRRRQTWLRTVEDDLRPLNFGLATARRRAMDRPAWRLLVDAATSSWHAPERESERERERQSISPSEDQPILASLRPISSIVSTWCRLQCTSRTNHSLSTDCAPIVKCNC